MLMKKFEDNGIELSQFYEYRIVHCPNCSKPVDFVNLKVTCIHCAYHKEFKAIDSWHSLAPITVAMEDYLQIPCCGQMLWAINLEHLDFLENYVVADIRERLPNINKSLASRLPQWMKSNKNRKEILKCISNLRLKLKEHNYRTNI